MKTDKNSTAFPFWEQNGFGAITHMMPGLTKREYFAAMAMQGLCSWNHNSGKMICNTTKIEEEAVELADNLIKELNK